MCPAAESEVPLLELRGVRKSFRSKRLGGGRRVTMAADDVSLRVHRGEALALVGESGSGKTTIGRIILRLERPEAGEVRLQGVDVLRGERRRASLAYRRRVQMVFQDPFGSLNPVHTVDYHLMRPLRRHGLARGGSWKPRVRELLATVGLEPAQEFVDRYPHELSGGQRQRVAIGRALAVDPDLLVADEPTSMLDVSIRMSILGLLAGLKRERSLGILLITHDLASARFLSERIAVLYRGAIVEEGPSESVVRGPQHPYTKALLAAMAGGGGTTAPADAVAWPAEGGGGGCPYAPRCPEVMDVCRQVVPEPRLHGGRTVRCHLYPETGRGPGGSPS